MRGGVSDQVRPHNNYHGNFTWQSKNPQTMTWNGKFCCYGNKCCLNDWICEWATWNQVKVSCLSFVAEKCLLFVENKIVTQKRRCLQESVAPIWPLKRYENKNWKDALQLMFVYSYTECRGQVTSYSGGPGNRLLWLRFFVIFLNPSRLMPA
jgi:hypothetical protein